MILFYNDYNNSISLYYKNISPTIEIVYKADINKSEIFYGNEIKDIEYTVRIESQEGLLVKKLNQTILNDFKAVFIVVILIKPCLIPLYIIHIVYNIF